MSDYYAEKLSAERLRRVYEVASPRVRQYLESEIAFALERIASSDTVLELGCGYGRVLKRLAKTAAITAGIDTSHASLIMARVMMPPDAICHLSVMNAVELGFHDRLFDTVVCVQNGISAFGVDRHRLIREALRVTRRGGKGLFSTYSARFWEDRLAWFHAQADHGLIGEIDEEATGDGIIVCKDGFRATTVGPEEFRSLASDLGVAPEITEVDDSSLFCEIRVP